MDEGLGIHAIGSYFRLQESLDKSYSELDNVNCETITYLNNIARKYVERECAPTGRLTQIIEKLKIERTIDGKLVDVLIPNLHLQKKPNVDD